MSSFSVQSHKGPYNVFFETDFTQLKSISQENRHFIIDAQVARIYQDQLKNVLRSSSVLIIDAKEVNKTLDKFTEYVEHLVENKIRRGHQFVAIGGGIIQDITCFLSATMLRGIPWIFYPTTLLAQTDSCIGSKSSINVGETKNILGTFTPPEQIFIDISFLKTLHEIEIRSGIGEMLKVHAIDGPASFDQIAEDYTKIIEKPELLKHYITRSLEIKKGLIEIDEFDKGPRNVMNYGHSFGHAIESATHFEIPHGIAVTIGMDMANYIAVNLGETDDAHYQRMHPVLEKNYSISKNIKINYSDFLSSLSIDKKNTNTQLKLILPNHDGKPTIGLYNNNTIFQKLCEQYLEQW